MEMINVMNTIPMVEGNNWWIGLLICAVTGIVSLILIFLFAKNNYEKASIVMAVMFILSFMIAKLSLILSSFYSPEKYECTIKDNVNATDFLNTFEIDSQRGDIYVVHLKEQDR